MDLQYIFQYFFNKQFTLPIYTIYVMSTNFIILGVCNDNQNKLDNLDLIFHGEHYTIYQQNTVSYRKNKFIFYFYLKK